jgi:hypothetical protein
MAKENGNMSQDFLLLTFKLHVSKVESKLKEAALKTDVNVRV